MPRVRAIGLTSMMVGVMTLGAADAAAQGPAHSFAELSPLLKVGQYVYITDDQGIVKLGRVVSLVGGQLELDGVQRPRSFMRRLFFVPVGLPVKRFSLTEDSVRRIKVDDSTWNGMLIGGVVGALFGWWGCSGSSEEACPLAGAGMIYVGVEFGEWIDDLIQTSLYVSPRRATISCGPVLTPTRVGITATVRF